MHLFSMLRPGHRLLLTFVPKKLAYLSYSCLNAPKMKIIPPPPAVCKTYVDKNNALKRALSPHLSIYKSQISSTMSITLRMTGFTLAIMAWVVSLTALLSDQNVDYYVQLLQDLELKDRYWTAAKTIVVYPFSFHFVAGIRHLLFDTAKLLEKPQFYATGYVTIAAAFILALYLGTIKDIRSKRDGSE